MLQTILVFAFGIVVGGVIAFILNHRHCYGYLRIDRSDPDGPYLFLELNESVESVAANKFVLLQVKQENFLNN